jgi:4-diphosphocytidyl-2C-methyl-D-erythritol kinase
LKLDWKAFLGLAITVFLLWFTMRDVDFADVWTHLKAANWGLLLAAVFVATFGFLIRALRWKVLLAPVRSDTSLRNRYAAVNIGFMANNLLPARVGEFARAYALSKVEPIALSAALGSLVVERVLDAVVLIGILVATMTNPRFPGAAGLREGPLGKALIAVGVLLVVLVVILVVLLAFPRRVIRFAERVAAALPGDLARPVVDALESFLGSLTVLRSPRLLLPALLWSVGFWLWHGLSFWLGQLAFGIHTGALAAYFTEAVVGFGVAVPAAPGFFGTFHAAASWALSVFGVQPASSLAFAYGYHLGGFIPVTLIGLWYAKQIGLSLKDVGTSGTRVEEAVEREMPAAARVLAEGAGGRPVDRATHAVLVDAPAKVNLSLHVGPRRADGFHDLATLFQAIDLCDVVELRRDGSGVWLETSGEDAGPAEQNLALRAARAYLAAAGLEASLTPGVLIRLEKRVPAGAGLGGGSSDAAATLRGLDRLFEGAVPAHRLIEIAAELGSDVPFFLAPTPHAAATGRGERLEPLDPHEGVPGIVLVPQVHVSTAEAYAALDRSRDGGGGAVDAPPAPLPVSGWPDIAARAHNDFEPVVAAAHPEIRAALAALRATRPHLALLAGSGSACFALYEDDGQADRAAAALGRDERWRLYRIRTLAAWPEPAET